MLFREQDTRDKCNSAEITESNSSYGAINLRLTLSSLLLRSLLVRIDEAGAPQFNSEEAHIVRKSPGDAAPLDLGHYLPK